MLNKCDIFTILPYAKSSAFHFTISFCGRSLWPRLAGLANSFPYTGTAAQPLRDRCRKVVAFPSKTFKRGFANPKRRNSTHVHEILSQLSIRSFSSCIMSQNHATK